MNVLFTTPLPVPYHVELFDALSAAGRVKMKVLYGSIRHPSRSWDTPILSHEHSISSDLSIQEADSLLCWSDLVVFSGYQPRHVRRLIAARDASGKPWAFWGERPGVVLPHWIGRYYRSIVLPQLHRGDVPIWGMGSWAANAYREEFGDQRIICNVPYFSKLKHYLEIDRLHATAPPRRILCSGNLIKRKGVDLLMKAFIAIAPDFPALELHFIGDGPLGERLRAMSTLVARRVHFHGFKQWQELPAYYAQADILCAPSRYDGWGLIIPEGLASGLLVVSTNRTGAARELVHPGCGWIAEAGSLHSLIDALRAAASTSGSERLARIATGRSIAVGQDIAAGVDRVVAAIEESMGHTKLR